MSVRNSSSSPHQFARTRQTRVASISPSGTLVASSTYSDSRSRTPVRGRRARQDADNDDNTLESGHLMRWRSGSRTLRGSIDGATVSYKARSVSRSKRSEPPLERSETLPNGKDVEVGGEQDKDKIKKPPIALFLPHPIPHFLGYRKPISELNQRHQHIKPYPSILPFIHHIPPLMENLIWTWVGAFVGISAIALLFARSTTFTSSIDVPLHSWMSPIVIGSFGASSVLLYATPSSPLGQPRSFVGGQFFSALVGVAITKLFRLSFQYNLDITDTSTSLVWLAGSVSTATALVVMTMTGTLHPPGGATALLCATNSQVERLGWKVIPIVLLSSFIMLIWSLIWMNLGRRRYPESFFAPSPPNASSGNVSQGLYNFVKNRIISTHSTASHKDIEDKTPQPPLPVPVKEDKYSKDVLKTDSEWRNIQEEEEEEEEKEERAERPSRWESARTRS